MNTSLIALLSAVLLLSAHVHADCADAEEGFSGFFKNLGCKVKQGAEDVAEAAKPYANKIGEGAKDFGRTVAHKYDEIKHQLTDDATPTPSALPPVNYNAPTERVPLAPIVSEPPSVMLP